MELQTAAAISRVALDVSGQLDSLLKLAMDGCDSVEFAGYRSSVGDIMARIYCDVLNPIFRQYPQLAPAELGGPGATKDVG
jgi:hypothetical protein